MAKYLSVVKSLPQRLNNIMMLHVPREENLQADLLSRVASSDLHSLEAQVLLEVLEVPSSESHVVVALGHGQITVGWMKPIQDYLNPGALPRDPVEAKRAGQVGLLLMESSTRGLSLIHFWSASTCPSLSKFWKRCMLGSARLMSVPGLWLTKSYV